MEGHSLDKYKVLEKVGEGGMASVYRGKHQSLGREVAIKVLHPHLSNIERNRIRFEREAQAIESLRHENIVEIFDYSGRTSEHCYIITEFIHGFTLKDWLEGHTLNSEMAASVARELSLALDYAHRNGIVHRDIKPENVMIRPDGGVKLMDFGIARVLDDTKVTLTGGLVGSPAYMSPEQALDGDIGPASDQFSLGILLYRAVTGHFPFIGKSPPIILRHIVEGNYVPPEDVVPDLDPELVQVIKRALQPTPADRYITAGDMAKALSHCLTVSGIPNTAEERARYFDGPEIYNAQLQTHLITTQLPKARALLEKRSTAQAMAILGRLLNYDAENEEILDLLSQLHQQSKLTARNAVGLLIVVGLPLSLALYLAWGWLSPQGDAPRGAIQVLPTPSPQSQVEKPRSTPSPRETNLTPKMPLPATGPKKAANDLRDRLSRINKRRIGTKPPPRATKPTPTATPAVAKMATLPGTLDLQSHPWGTIYVDGSAVSPTGKTYGNTLRALPITLSPGKHILRLSNPNCSPLEAEIMVEAGEILRKRYQLCPRMRILGLNPEDRLELDGKELGLGATISKPILMTNPPESHQLKVYRKGGNTLTRTVTPPSASGIFVVDLNDGSPTNE